MILSKTRLIPPKATTDSFAQVTSALREDRITLHYQPIVRADNHNFVGFFEGLARIEMEDGSVIPAGQFIPAIEHTPLGRALDRRTLLLATQALRQDFNRRISVNLSPYSMADPVWLEIYQAQTIDVGERLILEITESAAMSDVEMTCAFLRKVRKTGCSVALDDFGTGSTSFRYFRDFRFDIVKIDGIFIRKLPQSKDNRVLVEALVKISEHFDMFTVAEFIETAEEAQFAQELGVDCLQGYHIGCPMPTLEWPTAVLSQNQSLAI